MQNAHDAILITVQLFLLIQNNYRNHQCADIGSAIIRIIGRLIFIGSTLWLLRTLTAGQTTLINLHISINLTENISSELVYFYMRFLKTDRITLTESYVAQ